MRSIKPGRGPSAMGAFGSVAVGVFGVFWTIMAANMGAPPFFVLFGVVFIGIAVAQAIYHWKNATGKNRMSLYDITDADSEPDPLNRYLGNDARHSARGVQGPDRFDRRQAAGSYCPYCGREAADQAYRFCPGCGKALPR